jgi:hypothetical protein
VALPDDAVFEGCRSVVVQDLEIEPQNTEFRKEVYYSPSLQKSFVADLPPGYDGESGPGIRSLAISLKRVCNMSEPRILEFFQEHDVKISAATVSRMLTKKNVETFHREKADLYEAGLETGSHARIDDTSARVDGHNRHTQIVCGEHYAAYFTTERRDRLTVLDVLRRFGSREFLFDDEAARLLEQLRVSKKARAVPGIGGGSSVSGRPARPLNGAVGIAGRHGHERRCRRPRIHRRGQSPLPGLAALVYVDCPRI